MCSRGEQAPASLRPRGKLGGEQLEQLRVAREVLDLGAGKARRALAVARPWSIAAHASPDRKGPRLASAGGDTAQLGEATIEAERAEPVTRAAAHANDARPSL